MPSESITGAFRLGMFSKGSDGQARPCSIKGCHETTNNGKFYCTEHINKLPYVEDLVSRIERRKKEDYEVKIKGPDAVNFSGITAKEIILRLRLGGPKTEEGLSRELEGATDDGSLPIDKSIIHNYAVAMQKMGIVKFGISARYNLIVSLVDQKEEDFIDDADGNN